MQLQFKYGGVAYSVESILEFTKAELSDFWREPFFRFYPDVDKEAYNSLTDPERRRFLTSYFSAFEKENETLLQEKVKRYNECWNQHFNRIAEAFHDIFQLEPDNLLGDMQAMITFNPISPRYLDKHSFDCFYLQSERGALGSALHEIIHFVWFHVWQQHFHDQTKEYETPHLKWILSEMVVEPIMRDERLGGINPYYESKSCVYPYFYSMILDGRCVLDTLYDMLKDLPITEFMEQSYVYCQAHEAAIREHIRASENGSFSE